MRLLKALDEAIGWAGEGDVGGTGEDDDEEDFDEDDEDPQNLKGGIDVRTLKEHLPGEGLGDGKNKVSKEVSRFNEKSLLRLTQKLSFTFLLDPDFLHFL